MMSEQTYSPATGLKLTLALAAVLLLSGCISAEQRRAAADAEASMSETTVAQASTEEAMDSMMSEWVVSKGENLWWIAGREEVYNQAEQWPLIYKANASQIKDADLIYPGQVLEVPRSSSSAEVNRAVQHAKSRGAWAVGPVEAADQAYLSN